eukprot:MONOS_1244.1-p1 / transcript=MONOS_1244.1 / gene=MONOS_1244 / organism=Monocercomonoides_exilis_PA203 / gene_product=unspecified product / transcript_product=unspecified product / location=Mono_scaffold00021:94224-96168(+) / protein_length=634 / sequence_SO=supercontig / SO=protein_coding / is_pseudo=false
MSKEQRGKSDLSRFISNLNETRRNLLNFAKHCALQEHFIEILNNHLAVQVNHSICFDSQDIIYQNLIICAFSLFVAEQFCITLLQEQEKKQMEIKQSAMKRLFHHNYIAIGVEGATCSGKSTLSLMLHLIFETAALFKKLHYEPSSPFLSQTTAKPEQPLLLSSSSSPSSSSSSSLTPSSSPSLPLSSSSTSPTDYLSESPSSHISTASISTCLSLDDYCKAEDKITSRVDLPLPLHFSEDDSPQSILVPLHADIDKNSEKAQDQASDALSSSSSQPAVPSSYPSSTETLAKERHLKAINWDSENAFDFDSLCKSIVQWKEKKNQESPNFSEDGKEDDAIHSSSISVIVDPMQDFLFRFLIVEGILLMADQRIPRLCDSFIHYCSNNPARIAQLWERRKQRAKKSLVEPSKECIEKELSSSSSECSSASSEKETFQTVVSDQDLSHFVYSYPDSLEYWRTSILPSLLNNEQLIHSSDEDSSSLKICCKGRENENLTQTEFVSRIKILKTAKIPSQEQMIKDITAFDMKNWISNPLKSDEKPIDNCHSVNISLSIEQFESNSHSSEMCVSDKFNAIKDNIFYSMGIASFVILEEIIPTIDIFSLLFKIYIKSFDVIFLIVVLQLMRFKKYEPNP